MTHTLAALAVLSLASTLPAAGPRIDLVVAADAPPLEKLAATELAEQLKRLFDAEVRVGDTPGSGHLIYLGSPATNPRLKAVAGDRWPKLSEQGHLLKSIPHEGKPALLVGGGSPVATLWAAYELGYRFGIRYFPFGDVLPAEKPAFKLDGFDLVLEPQHLTRAWTALGPEVIGGEMWGLTDTRALIRQLAKLKFNRIVLEMHPWQPFVDYEFRGIRKQTGVLGLGRRFPVEGDTAGKTAFAAAAEFTNPDLAGKTTYAERTRAGVALARGILDAAHERGLSASIAFPPNQFPAEFAKLLPGARPVPNTNGLAIEAGGGQGDPRAATQLREVQQTAYRSTYQTADAPPRRSLRLLPLSLRSIGVLPQLRTHAIQADLRRESSTLAEGFAVVGVIPGEMGPALHYLSRASFDWKVTPESAHEELISVSCGPGVSERTAKAFRLLEDATELLEREAGPAGAPDPDVLTRHYQSTSGPPAWVKKARDLYTKSYEDTLRGMQRSKAGPGSWLFYVSKRHEFALAYLSCVESLGLAGQAKAKGENDAHAEQLEKAVESLYNALTAYAEVARDPSDRGAIAVLNEFGYRPLMKLLDGATK